MNLSLPLKQKISSSGEEKKTKLKVSNVTIIEAMRDITKTQKRKTGGNVELNDETDTFKTPTVNKKVKDMNEEERRSYHRKQYKRRKDELSLEEIVKLREDWSSRKSTDRGKKRDKDEEGFKQSRCAEKSTEREKERKENESKYKRKRTEEQAKARKLKSSTDEKRGKSFRDSIRDGRSYECVCCERLCFKNGVKQFTHAFVSSVEKDHPNLINKAIGARNAHGNHHICLTCKSYLSRGKVPPMSNQNSLQLMDLSQYKELNLTELENSMIALNIIFQKVFKLPKSRWPAMKDKTVNIPIFQTDILNTVDSLPRTPSAAGIIPINFKRKLNYKNSHMTQYISVPKILKALNTLKELGNPYYQFIPYTENFEDECRENDLEGFQFIYPEDEVVEDIYETQTEDTIVEDIAKESGKDNEFIDEIVEDVEDGIVKTGSGMINKDEISNEFIANMANNTATENEIVDEIDNSRIKEDNNDWELFANDSNREIEIEKENIEENNTRNELIDEIEKDNIDAKEITDPVPCGSINYLDIVEEISHESKPEDEDAEFDRLEKEEEDYKRNDPVKKWQFEYNRSTCFSDNYPEISYKEDNGERISIAPGEGKTPSNILQEKDWDLKSFPCLLPDGNNSLHSGRDVKLKEQDYFTQRIMNKDNRFATNPAYVFAAVAYIEKKQIEGRKGIAFKRGLSSTSDDGTTSYSLDDPYSVLDNVKNTPRYWQKTRYELMARLENLGAFTFFFTLSCADMRWPENFTALLQGHTFTYEEINYKEEVFVGEGEKKEPLSEFLSRNASKHTFIQKNLLNATVTFHQRVKMFVKHIIMSTGNPMCIKYNSYKVEFALRGAGHIHGILWVDWDNFIFPQSEEEEMNDGNNMEKETEYNEDPEKNDEQDKKSILIKAFEKIRNEEILNKTERNVIADFADLFITCSLKDPKTKKIVEEVQIHHHTHTCRKYCPKCRFYFPRFPSLKTIVSVPFQKLEGDREQQLDRLQKSNDTLKLVSKVLEDEDEMEELIQFEIDEINKYVNIQVAILAVQDLIQKADKDKMQKVDVNEPIQTLICNFTEFQKENSSLTKVELETVLDDLKVVLNLINIKQIEERRLHRLLEKAGVKPEGSKSTMEVYEEALGVSKSGYKIIHKRDIDELFVNNYNPEWIFNWNANIDLQLCLDYYAVITYISDYYSKDDSGTMGHIKEALKKARNESLQTKLSLVIHQFLTHRQIGESEAFFKILPHLQMKSSNIETVFVPTGFKMNRSGFLKELTKEEAKTCSNVIKVVNKDGLFTEKPSLLDKFERKDTSENLINEEITYTQFSMKYVSCNSQPKSHDFKSKVFLEGDNGFQITDEMNLIVTHDFEVRKEHHSLPNFIKLTNLRPGEPKFMRKRTRQVVRFHKIDSTKKPHEYYYSQLQLYSPFKSEEDLEPDSLEKCQLLFNERSEHNGCLKIGNVKSILMKHLDCVEDGLERAQETINSNVADIMDSTLQQDNEECADEGVEDHPDFVLKDPSDLLAHEPERGRFKTIELYDEQTLDIMSRNLDEDQKVVLETGINFAKSIVKSRKKDNALVSPELLVVQGGAGTGKSTVIDVLSQQMEKVLRTSGDNPDHPYIIKAAFTGTAAANIKGQTLHSAFSFSFGNEFFSLSDKARDEKRNQLENLLVVIIDEFSFIKADMLYLLDMRLREVKQVPDAVFGGVSVFLFGDILQLRPVCAGYIFEDPISERFQLVALICSLWKLFKVVILKTNHRQGEDKQYADILNRIRTGEFTNEDIEMLETRVRAVNHPDIPEEALVITCTNKEVNKINEERLATINKHEYVSESMNKTNKLRQFKPRTDPSGAISGTPLQKSIKLKVGAKVMLTYNIDTCDCLTNGAFGEVLGFQFNKDGSMKQVYIHFYNEDCGKEKRKNFVNLQKQFPGKNVLPIEKIEFQYSLSKKSNAGAATATVVQFPLRLAFASTAHKVQGMTIKKPNHLVVDLRSVREAAQAYVILSRVQAMSQLLILESVCPDKITASAIAIDELDRMKKEAINNIQRKGDSIITCNIRSLNKNFDNFVSSSLLKRAEVICLQETWLDPLIPSVNLLEGKGWAQHNNSMGRGKGISTFYQRTFSWDQDITKPAYQMTKLRSGSLDVINVYRSAGAQAELLIHDVSSMISSEKQTLIVGDFNLCYISDYSHQLFEALRVQGFQQIVKNPTHIEGRLIDLVFINNLDLDITYEVEQQAQFFTDHDLIEVKKGSVILKVNMN